MAIGVGLSGPVDLALAKTTEQVPASRALPGGCRYELKWDGYRIAAVVKGGKVRLWSRNGTDLTDRFPDVGAAVADQVTMDAVIDGVI